MSQPLREQDLRETMALAGLAPRTTYIYVRKLQATHEWLQLRGQHIDTAPATLIAKYAETLPYSRSTRIQLRSALKRYYEVIGRAPSPHLAVHSPKKRRMTCRALSEAQARALYRRAAGWDSGPEGIAVLLGMLMALRRAEIAGLKWADFSADMVTIRGKGGVIADIPVHPLVAERLVWWRDFVPGDHLGVGPGLVNVFEGRRYTERGHVTPSTIWSWVDRVADAADLGHVTTHVLRHTALAAANDATGDLRAVQELARHKDPEVTAGYTRVNKDRMVAAMLAIKYD